jgi:hypothetical protein
MTKRKARKTKSDRPPLRVSEVNQPSPEAIRAACLLAVSYGIRFSDDPPIDTAAAHGEKQKEVGEMGEDGPAR